MSLDELIQQGWAKHHSETEAVAARLEAGVDLVADPDGAAKFMHLVNHCVGGHLKDRARALTICEGAMSRLDGEPEGKPALQLAVARRLGGDEPGAQALQARLGDDDGALVQVNMLVAEGHMNAGDWDQADALYRETLVVALALPAGHSGERTVGVVSNNIASELLEAEQRTRAQDSLMLDAAEASRTFWLRVGTWVHDERADYLLSLVHTAVGQHADGRRFADRGLQTIADNGDESVDEAFLHLARARACRDGGDAEAQQASLARAKTLAADFDPGLVSWFEGEWAKST